MRLRRLFSSVTVGLCAILVATGVALTPVAPAFAEEAVGTPTATPSPVATETPTAAPSPESVEPEVPAPSAEPEATTEPSAEPSPKPTAEPSQKPTEEPTVQPDQIEPPETELAPVERFAEARAVGFNPGLIVSDYNFYNSWAMTEGEIQNFLDAKIGTCENSNCLNVYRTNTPTKTWSWGTCSTYNGAANESAAAIIFKVQRACGISAKAILVTLQKEQGLVTRTSPSAAILQKAMGYGCPDTADCDKDYYGFFNQVFAAGRQLTWYNNPEGSFTSIKVGQVNPVRFHPNASCGSANVTIQNKATAALYYYTPYQPTAAALAAGYGASSDPCASYGNRNFYNYYRDWFGDPAAASSPQVARLSGETRYSTAAAISKATYPVAGVPVVYITSGENFPDSLSAAPAAASQGGPILMVTSGSAPGETLAELKRLKPKRIVVIGGTHAVSDSVFATLSGVQANIERIAGADRFDTSRKIAAAVFPNATTAYLASGLNFPDALSASVAAGAQDIPVVLLDGSAAIDTATSKALGRMTSVKLAGGVVSISASQEASVKSKGITTKRLWGADRFQTSVAINRDAFPTASTMYLASGLAFPDAVAGAAAAGALGSPLYVTNPGCVSGEIRADIFDKKVKNLVLLGGPVSLNDGVAVLAGC